jgi:hypothetical protein
MQQIKYVWSCKLLKNNKQILICKPGERYRILGAPGIALFYLFLIVRNTVVSYANSHLDTLSWFQANIENLLESSWNSKLQSQVSEFGLYVDMLHF